MPAASSSSRTARQSRPCSAALRTEPNATCSPCSAVPGRSRSSAWLNRCSEPEQGREEPAISIAMPLRTNPSSRRPRNSREGRPAPSDATSPDCTRSVAVCASRAAKSSTDSRPAAAARRQSCSALGFASRSPRPARAPGAGAVSIAPRSATTAIGMRARTLSVRPSSPAITAIGEAMPSAVNWVGTLITPMSQISQASLATSIVLPPPTATTASAPASEAAAASTAARLLSGISIRDAASEPRSPTSTSATSAVTVGPLNMDNRPNPSSAATSVIVSGKLAAAGDGAQILRQLHQPAQAGVGLHEAASTRCEHAVASEREIVVVVDLDPGEPVNRHQPDRDLRRQSFERVLVIDADVAVADVLLEDLGQARAVLGIDAGQADVLGVALVRRRLRQRGDAPAAGNNLHRLVIDAVVGRAENSSAIRRHQLPGDRRLEQHVAVDDVTALR